MVRSAPDAFAHVMPDCSSVGRLSDWDFLYDDGIKSDRFVTAAG